MEINELMPSSKHEYTYKGKDIFWFSASGFPAISCDTTVCGGAGIQCCNCASHVSNEAAFEEILETRKKDLGKPSRYVFTCDDGEYYYPAVLQNGVPLTCEENNGMVTCGACEECLVCEGNEEALEAYLKTNKLMRFRKEYHKPVIEIEIGSVVNLVDCSNDDWGFYRDNNNEKKGTLNKFVVVEFDGDSVVLSNGVDKHYVEYSNVVRVDDGVIPYYEESNRKILKYFHIPNSDVNAGILVLINIKSEYDYNMMLQQANTKIYEDYSICGKNNNNSAVRIEDKNSSVDTEKYTPWWK